MERYWQREMPELPLVTGPADLWPLLEWLDRYSDGWSFHQAANREDCVVNVDAQHPRDPAEIQIFAHYMAGPYVQECCDTLAELPLTLYRAAVRFYRGEFNG